MIKQSKNKKHSLSDKLEAVNLYNQGFGSVLIGRQLSISDSVIERWLQVYKNRGIEGFQKSGNIRATLELKQTIVKEVLENKLSYNAVILKYHVSQSAVYSWVQQAKRYGYSSLSELRKQGRPPKIMGRPKKKEPETELEKIQAEVDYLKAENAYLKKLRALVADRVARESGKKPTPSNR